MQMLEKMCNISAATAITPKRLQFLPCGIVRIIPTAETQLQRCDQIAGSFTAPSKDLLLNSSLKVVNVSLNLVNPCKHRNKN